jgi:hypothetical protein
MNRNYQITDTWNIYFPVTYKITWHYPFLVLWGLFYDAVSTSECTDPNGRLIRGYLTGRKRWWPNRVLSRHFPWGTKESHETAQSRQSVFRQRFKPSAPPSTSLEPFLSINLPNPLLIALRYIAVICLAKLMSVIPVPRRAQFEELTVNISGNDGSFKYTVIRLVLTPLYEMDI